MGNVAPVPVGSEQKKLLEAIRTKDVQKVRQLFGEGGKKTLNVNDVFASTKDLSTACYVTPLIAAVNFHSKELVELLLAKGADPLFKDDMGWTALLYASHSLHNDPEIVELLCKKSPPGPMHVTHLGYTPLMLAANRGHGDVLRPLLRSQSLPINASASGSYGFQVTALMLATRYEYKQALGDKWNKKGGITDTIVQLIDNGAYINVMDKATEGNGRTPILQAMHHNDFISMFYLITGGADLSVTNRPVGKKPDIMLNLVLTNNGKYTLEETEQVDLDTGETQTYLKKGEEWDKFGELIKVSLDSKASVGVDFMCNLYFEWRLLSVMYRVRGGKASTALVDGKKYREKSSYLSDIEKFVESTAALWEDLDTQNRKLVSFVLTCPRPIFVGILNFFIFDEQVNSWLCQLDEILNISSDRELWRRHWDSRLALRKQHVVQDELNLTYELRGKKDFPGGKGGKLSQRNYCFGILHY